MTGKAVARKGLATPWASLDGRRRFAAVPTIASDSRHRSVGATVPCLAKPIWRGCRTNPKANLDWPDSQHPFLAVLPRGLATHQLQCTNDTRSARKLV